MTQEYNAESILTLEGLKHIRHRPSMYIGSVEADGLHQINLEILSNSVDEYLNGGATRIDVTLTKRGSIIIQDDGRGVPIGTHSSGCSTLEAVFGIPNTGGKYDNEGKSGYNSSGGTNGIGAKATNALSSYFRAQTFRDGKGEEVVFSEGILQSHSFIKSPGENFHGTIVEFIPDATVLNVVTFDAERIKRQLQEFSYLCKGLTFTFTPEEGPSTIYHSENGLLDYIHNLNTQEAICEPFYCNTQGLEIAMLFNVGSSYKYKLYTNNIPQSKGTHHTGFKTALTKSINQYARDKGFLKEKDENLQGTDLEEGQVLVLSLHYLNPIYEGQNKDNLTSLDVRGYVQKIAGQEIQNWLESNPKDAKLIIEKALVSKKAREAAKKARAAVKNKAEKTQALKFDSKLVDAYSKDRSKCEIFIVEGDSAGGNMKLAKNNEFQALLPIRGKILNVLKAPLEKVIANAEIMTMISAFGLTLDAKKKTITVDEDNLRYGKIIITSDADIDGSHIQTLFYTFIFTFVPELIEKGYIYASIPPLYKIEQGKGYTYLKDDVALEEWKAAHPGAKYVLKRNKGLGEMDVKELKPTILDPKTRGLKQITMDDAAATAKLFNELMGDNAALRKAYLDEHSGEVEVYV